MSERQPVTVAAELELQERMIALIRAFGLHRPEETPCGEPISVAEAHALSELSRGAPMVQKELAARLCLEKSTVSRLVGLLDERGWVERVRSSEDGRAVVIGLTCKGRDAAASLAEARRAKFSRVLGAIPESRRGQVIEALGVLEEAIRNG